MVFVPGAFFLPLLAGSTRVLTTSSPTAPSFVIKVFGWGFHNPPEVAPTIGWDIRVTIIELSSSKP